MDAGPLVLLLALWGQVAIEPPAQTDVRDVEVTLYARRALLQHDALAKLNLGVRVDYGVATLWGPVPSRELAEQAVKVLSSVRGIYRVRDEMSYTNAATDEAVRSMLSGLVLPNGPLDLVPWMPPARRAPPSGSLPPSLTRPPEQSDREEVLSARTDSIDREERKETTWPPRPIISLLAPVEAPSESPPAPPAAQTQPTVLLAPQLDAPAPTRPAAILTPMLTSSPAVPSSDLRNRLEQLRATDPRFRRIDFTVADGVVLLRGQMATADDLIDFARRVSRLPNVRQVDVRPVKVNRD